MSERDEHGPDIHADPLVPSVPVTRDGASGSVEAAADSQPDPRPDDLGLSIDMIDADRLRMWAEKIGIHGGQISHWGDPYGVAEKMRELADNLETAVRDIGTLRAERDETLMLAGHPDISNLRDLARELAYRAQRISELERALSARPTIAAKINEVARDIDFAVDVTEPPEVMRQRFRDIVRGFADALASDFIREHEYQREEIVRLKREVEHLYQQAQAGDKQT